MATSLLVGLIFMAVGGLLSPWIVMKKIGTVTQGFAHSSFGGLALAVVLVPPVGGFLGLSHFILNLVFVTLLVVLLSYSQLDRQDHQEVSLNIFFVGAMALGLVVSSLFGSYVDFAGYLFGNLLVVGVADLWVGTGFLCMLLSFYSVYRKRLLYWVFDESHFGELFPKAGLVRLVFLLMVGWTVVLLTKVLGIVLMGASLLVPGAIALRLVRQINQVVLVSMGLAISFFAIGASVSFWWDVPLGASVCLVQVIAFVLFSLKRKQLVQMGVMALILISSAPAKGFTILQAHVNNSNVEDSVKLVRQVAPDLAVLWGVPDDASLTRFSIDARFFQTWGGLPKFWSERFVYFRSALSGDVSQNLSLLGHQKFMVRASISQADWHAVNPERVLPADLSVQQKNLLDGPLVHLIGEKFDVIIFSAVNPHLANPDIEGVAYLGMRNQDQLLFLDQYIQKIDTKTRLVFVGSLGVDYRLTGHTSAANLGRLMDHFTMPADAWLPSVVRSEGENYRYWVSDYVLVGNRLLKDYPNSLARVYFPKAKALDPICIHRTACFTNHGFRFKEKLPTELKLTR